VDGQVVVDLWGGWSDQATRRPWQADTLVNVFSVGKGLIAVRQLLSHQAGLPAVRPRLPPGAVLDWPVMTAALAAQEPWWEPGAGHGYHVNTFGFLAGEVIRRVTGATVGELLRTEIAGPLGADVHIGLPAALAEATTEQVYGPDLVLNRPSRFGLGFQLTQPERPLGPGPSAFGHFGAGGSLGFGDPDAGLAFGYVMNQMGPRWQNPRTRALIDAAYSCL
jgi:CubicO group peptidase (beta-lactamase class C family)